MLRRTMACLAVSVVVACGTSASLAQVGTAVTYQGQLKSNGVVVNTPSDVRFSIWDAATGGNQVGTTDTKLGVAVSQGLFSTTFDCGVSPYTADAARWVQIEVRNPANTGGFVPLGGRQRLTGVPFSESTRGLSMDSANNATFSGRASVGDLPGFSSHMFSSRVGAVQGVDVAIFGSHSGTSGFNAGVYGRSQSPNGYGVFSEGNFQTNGNATILGTLGIGSTGPALRALHLSGNAVGLALQDTGDADGANARWALDTRAFGVPGIALVRYDGAGANALKSVFLSNSGNLGVGTTAFNKIDVQVGSYIGNSTILGSQVNDPANRGVKVGFGYRPNEVGCAETFTGMRVEVVDGTNGCGVSEDLSFWTAECNTSCPREVMRVNGRGRIGMGTSAPSHKLTVVDDSSMNTARLVGPTGQYQWNARLNFGDDDYVRISENDDDVLDLKGANGIRAANTFSAPAKNFRIDHPSDPANMVLNHGCIESDQYVNLYRGNAVIGNDGGVWIQLPSWMNDLNTDFSYQLTSVGAAQPNLYVAVEVNKSNQFRVAGGQPGAKVSWQITGVRHDAYVRANPLVVEEVKSGSEAGTYLSPQSFGIYTAEELVKYTHRK